MRHRRRPAARRRACAAHRIALVVGQGRQSIGQPNRWVILAISANERLVLLTEVNLQAAQRAAGAVFADPSFGKNRHRGPTRPARVERIFRAEDCRVIAAEIAVSCADLPVVRQVLGNFRAIEKSRLDVEGLIDPTDRHSLTVAGLDTGDAFNGPTSQIGSGFSANPANMQTAEPIPVRV